MTKMCPGSTSKKDCNSTGIHVSFPHEYYMNNNLLCVVPEIETATPTAARKRPAEGFYNEGNDNNEEDKSSDFEKSITGSNEDDEEIEYAEDDDEDCDEDAEDTEKISTEAKLDNFLSDDDDDDDEEEENEEVEKKNVLLLGMVYGSEERSQIEGGYVFFFFYLVIYYF
jgi:hypothetical protein